MLMSNKHDIAVIKPAQSLQQCEMHVHGPCTSPLHFILYCLAVFCADTCPTALLALLRCCTRSIRTAVAQNNSITAQLHVLQ